MFDSSLKIIKISVISLIILTSSICFGASESKTPEPKPAEEKPKPEFPSLEEVTKDYTKVVSTADGERSYYTVWTREKDGQILAALPSGYENKKFFIALTIASGENFAGLQAGDLYVYWKRYDKRLALVEPNIQIKSTGDQESKSSIERLFTDRIILDVPIVSMSGGSPVIDMDELLAGQASKFFGSSVRASNPNLIKIKKAKAFPKNIELAIEIPTSSGRLQTLYYSISEIPDRTGYKPRKADERIGYFTTSFSDYGIFNDPETKVRYINRWNLEKADGKLTVSPPKNPIVFYIEHTTPVRYRRWVREGILYWNKAFEKVGISNAVEVYYQDEASGAHMEKDPEDVRYNFIRWLSNNEGTAIGPSRVNPETGEILDADIILTDGWIRHFWSQYNEIMPEIAMEGISPQTLVWLNSHPNWDPRIRLAPPAQRESIKQQIAQNINLPLGGHPMAHVDPSLIGDDEYDGLIGRTSQINGMCTLSHGMALDVAMFRMQMALMADTNDKSIDPNSKTVEDKESKIDGMPEQFIGPMISELVCHEVGHTLGLRHNFKGSGTYTMAQINSREFKGNKTTSSSVMDYLPINMNYKDGEVQGDYTMIGVGEYDIWAIAYGYSQDEKELKKILARVAEPELQYGTDEDTYGPDPMVRKYDFSKEPLEYAENQIRIAKYNRDRIIDKLVKDGDSWAKTRKAYEMTLSLQLRSISTMANWLGGAYIYRDKKGDPNARLPIDVVPAKKQRDALQFVINNTFRDDAFGLSEDLLKRMTTDKWLDDNSMSLDESTWPIHDRVIGIQASVLSSIMYPDTLRQIYDNEFLVPSDEDAFTLPELLDTITNEIWSELKTGTGVKHTDRKPMISSLRRNLQRTYIELMIDLTRSDYQDTSAYKPIGNLVMLKLRDIKDNINNVINNEQDNLDPYTKSHLTDAAAQIEKALEAQYIYKVL
ncbi:MAG: zinc-dependent metalloprotease [Sedimentisphaerales bacterium]|nr:zinc-dependent metalloprotease [Sedimentisphaerales bacterium]